MICIVFIFDLHLQKRNAMRYYNIVENNPIIRGWRCSSLKSELREKVATIVCMAVLTGVMGACIAIAYKQTSDIFILLCLIIYMSAGFIAVGMLLGEAITILQEIRDIQEMDYREENGQNDYSVGNENITIINLLVYLSNGKNRKAYHSIRKHTMRE